MTVPLGHAIEATPFPNGFSNGTAPLEDDLPLMSSVAPPGNTVTRFTRCTPEPKMLALPVYACHAPPPKLMNARATSLSRRLLFQLDFCKSGVESTPAFMLTAPKNVFVRSHTFRYDVIVNIGFPSPPSVRRPRIVSPSPPFKPYCCSPRCE